MAKENHYRTVWLSDIHLGSKDCKAEYLLDFLQHNTIDTLYLVGDIVDMWAMSRQFMWPESHNKLLHTLLTLPNSNTRVVYLPGNHDEPAQKYDGMQLGDIEILRQTIHQTANGKRLLLLHGDQFDQYVCFGPVHAWIGDKGYDLLLFINRWYNRVRNWLGFPYWSLAGYLKSKVKGAGHAVERYKDACRQRAREMGVDGVVCGHIHHPEIEEKDGILYCNDGDWVENCSALTEDEHGQLALVYWTHIASHTKLHQLKPLNNAPSNKAA